MRRNSYKKNIIFIVILITVIASISIAYSLLSSTLNVQFGNVTQNVYTFDVGFPSQTVSGSSGGSSFSNCGIATAYGNSATIQGAELFFGASCTFEFTIKNSGSLSSKLTAITKIVPENMTCNDVATGQFRCYVNPSYIHYRLCSDSACNTLLTTNTTLASNQSMIVYLKIYSSGSAGAINENAHLSGGGFKLTFQGV